jgi:hypothetical protein
MVKAAYSSGRPSLGVGAGNTPALIDETAHIKMAVSSIILSKTFDNGMICASEQSVIVVDSIYEEVRQEFIDRGAYLLSPEEREKVAGILLKDGHINPDIVGQSVEKLAAIAGIYVPELILPIINEIKQLLIGKNPEEIVFQAPADAKAMFPNEALKFLEYWHRGGEGHALDAIRHALLRLVKLGWKPVKLLER